MFTASPRVLERPSAAHPIHGKPLLRLSRRHTRPHRWLSTRPSGMICSCASSEPRATSAASTPGSAPSSTRSAVRLPAFCPSLVVRAPSSPRADRAAPAAPPCALRSHPGEAQINPSTRAGDHRLSCVRRRLSSGSATAPACGTGARRMESAARSVPRTCSTGCQPACTWRTGMRSAHMLRAQKTRGAQVVGETNL